MNEHGDPSFLFQHLSPNNINNQLAKFEKNLSVCSYFSGMTLIVHAIETRLINLVCSLGKIASRRKKGGKEGDFTGPFISVAVSLILA